MFVTAYPLIPGIDLAGTVIESTNASHHGGYSEIARVPAKWVVRLPEGLTLRESMILGTAGFTAALSVQRLEDNGLQPKKGPVLVAGATGGIGSIAVDIIS